MKVRLAIALLGWAAVYGPALAVDVAAERARIREERAAVQRRFADNEWACRTQFVVNRCLEAARAERSETLERLRHEELTMEDSQRKERAAERTAKIREKEAAASEPIVRAREATSPRPPAKRKSPSPEPAREDPTEVAAREAANRAAFEEKQRNAAERRAEVERRNAQRAAKTKPAAPLPTSELPASGQ
jgi:colicin import membrane protein